MNTETSEVLTLVCGGYTQSITTVLSETRQAIGHARSMVLDWFNHYWHDCGILLVVFEIAKQQQSHEGAPDGRLCGPDL
jgi:hypothetical protein